MTRRSTRSTFAEPLTKSLSWDIAQTPVSVNGKTLSNYQALVRNDNQDVLAVTKKSYHPATNERFLEVVSKLHEFTGFDVKGYSVFQGGRKVLAYLKNTENMRIGEFDSENYMVVGNSFDCTTGFFTGISNVVIRCSNQFSKMSIQHKVRHNKQLSMKLDGLVLFYKGFMQEQQALQQTFTSWSEQPIEPKFAEKFVNHVLDIKSDDLSTMKENQRRSLMESVGTEMDAMGATLYGLFNGLTHYSSHVVRTSGKLFGNPIGHSASLNNRGFQLLSSK
ncbi:DUF932 domain-containing protein [Chryseolinea sp. T2]|uniref:DUF932 domain-containing protein n=1 Tax=Chryseolinea sp. T2 TaxID=3129255 RepID=UPI0030768849